MKGRDVANIIANACEVAENLHCFSFGDRVFDINDADMVIDEMSSKDRVLVAANCLEKSGVVFEDVIVVTDAFRRFCVDLDCEKFMRGLADHFYMDVVCEIYEYMSVVRGGNVRV